MRVGLAVGLCVLLVTASVVAAQDVPRAPGDPSTASPAPPEGTDTPLFSLGGGPGVPHGATGDAHDTGFHVSAGGVFPVAGRLGIDIGASYTRLGADREAALTALGYDPATFASAGGFLEGGYRWAGALTAGARLLLRPRNRQVVPYVSAGAGYGVAGVASQNVLYLGVSDTIAGGRESGAAVAFGAGLEVRVGDGVGIFGSVRRLTVFTEPRFAATMPVTLGISLRLENR